MLSGAYRIRTDNFLLSNWLTHRNLQSGHIRCKTSDDRNCRGLGQRRYNRPGPGTITAGALTFALMLHKMRMRAQVVCCTKRTDPHTKYTCRVIRELLHLAYIVHLARRKGEVDCVRKDTRLVGDDAVWLEAS